MLYVKRIVFYLFLIIAINFILLYVLLDFSMTIKVAGLIVLAALYIYYNIKPDTDKGSPVKHKVLIGGYELLLASAVLYATQTLLHIYLFRFIDYGWFFWIISINLVVSMALAFLISLNGFIRVFSTAGQLGLGLRLALIFMWWIPVANTILFAITCRTVKKEYRILFDKRIINESRAGNKICQTKYPILMVHGVFFRDWKYVNYWGRIPKELTNNGASIFYGNHNSSLTVEQSAEELEKRITEIINETNCGKLNVIAHSKGGLDMRYAISCLDMDKYVASLTTVNTPHRGSPIAGTAVDKLPEKLVSTIGSGYEKLFTKLGVDNIDFLGSINGLTPEKCEELNGIMTDREGILYQSLGSTMSSVVSAAFPLNAGYAILKHVGGDNDGLVCTDSMMWGDFLGVQKTFGRKGISHGDIIDMTRKNIPGFDVSEYFVDLVYRLKEKGL